MPTPPPVRDAAPEAHAIYRRASAMGIGQKDLAVRAGLNPTYVRDLYQAKSKHPHADKLAKIAAILGCSVTDLQSNRTIDLDELRQKGAKEPPDYWLLIEIWSRLTDAERETWLRYGMGLIPPRRP